MNNVSFGSKFEIRQAQALDDKKFMTAMVAGYELAEIGIPVSQADNIVSDEDLFSGKDITITYKTADQYDELLVSFLVNRGVKIHKINN